MLTPSVHHIKPWRMVHGLLVHLLEKKAWYSDAASVFRANEIVPHIISVPPPKFAQIKYPSGATVNAGNILAPKEVESIPEVSYEADAKAFHLLYFTDPDSPSRGRPTFREWHIWLVGNIPGTDVGSGEVLSEYISPCPPIETGKHRFVFLIFQQPSKLKFDERRLNNKRTSHRELFKIQALVDKYKLGSPIAGNFFIAQWDQHVDLVYERLSRL